MKRLSLGVALLCLLLASAGALRAQEEPVGGDRREAFVYATTYFDGLTYGSALVPPETGTLYLLAESQNIVAPRVTQLYFWPLTNQYQADWRRQNELVEGTLEITQGGSTVDEIALTTFVIQYDSTDILNSIRLYTGTEAEAAHAAFTVLQGQYREALAAHGRAQAAYEAALREIVRENEPGTVSPDALPPRPEPPAPLTLFSTDPVAGYVVALPAGDYRLRLRLPDGSLHPDGDKALVVYTARREGVSYEVTPKSRWTRPEQALDGGGVIYAAPESTLYLRPSRAAEYNTRAYQGMSEPQADTAREDRYLWVAHEPLPAPRARITSGGQTIETDLTPYYVRQLGGGTPGYDIIPWDAGVSDRPSFDGFEVEVGAGGSSTIELLDANGTVIPGSRREIRPLQTGRAWALYALAALPLGLGALVIGARRRSTRRLGKGDITA